MNSLEANIRENSTKGQLNAIRDKGDVPAIIYGGKDQNQKIMKGSLRSHGARFHSGALKR